MFDVKNLTVKYQNSDNDAVCGVSFSLKAGSFTGLVGESGSGKSTIVSTSLGLLPKGAETKGEMFFEGKDILRMREDELRTIRWKEIALIPQSALNSFTPVITIGHHIKEVLAEHSNMIGNKAEDKVDGLLVEVGLDASIKNRYPHELSGGQKQRAAIALALACSPSLLFADEPTTALDVVTQAGILNLLARLRKEKKLTVLLITHDLPMAATICDKLLVMKNGLIVEEGTPKEIICNPQDAHTKALVNAILN
ncbi:MAG: ABC transporter ATP-binding protein [Synergistaceae bacterium]|nr:ABC transporter ATP-binding protein [Synergistaceae bacterium]